MQSNTKIKFFLIILFVTNQYFSAENNYYLNNHSNCKICHVSTEELNETTFTPIWSIENNNNYYIPYSSNTIDAVIGQPSGVSKMCLSCHDGTIASDDKGGQAGFSHKIISSNMNANHPISFTYDIVLAQKDGELYVPETTPSGLGSTINNDLLVNGKLECVSCHNPHESANNIAMLKISNDRSRLCLTCHIK